MHVYFPTTGKNALVTVFKAAALSGALDSKNKAKPSNDDEKAGNVDDSIDDPNTNDPWDYLELGRTYAIEQSKYDKAIKAFDKAISLDPNFSYAYRDRANAYYYKGKYDEALKDIQKALELKPDDGWGCAIKARMSVINKAVNDAIKEYTKGIELILKEEPNNTDMSWLYLERGHCYLSKAMLAKAISDFKTAAKMGDEGAKGILDALSIDYK